MPSGFPNKPKILHGAFVEFGLSLPPLSVVFQFNPLQLTRNRSLAFAVPGSRQREEDVIAGNTKRESQSLTLRNFHQAQDNLIAIRDNQQVVPEEESLSFEIRLDATDDLNDGDPIAQRLGILPRLATLELMMHPKGESLLGGLVDNLLSLNREGFSFTKQPNPPMMLFIWGHRRVLPVNINSINITETEFDTFLNPIRATAAVNLTVIEGKNAPYSYSKLAKEEMSALHLAKITEVAEVVIPG